MGSLLGFRPPHFSEEEAWLPAWLQPSTINSQAVECLSGEKNGRVQQSISTSENRNSSNDGTNKSLRLFLSGEDNSPMIFPSCSSNHEVQFHLHLSSTSNDESQYSRNPTLIKSQDTSEFKQPEAKVISEEDKAYMVPSQQKGNLGITVPKIPRFKKVVNPKLDISDAIELAVAASEALTIHEALKDELTATSVLEAAVRVKQARLENFKQNLSSSFEENIDFDFDCDDLSDLDYLTMTDAYDDVGLTVTSHDDLSGYGSVSHVNDSFASEIYTYNAKHKSNDFNDPKGDFCSISSKQHQQVDNDKISSKDSILKAFETVTREEHVDCALLGTENADLACDVDPVFNCSVEQTEFHATERECFPSGDLKSPQTILRSNEREDTMTNLVVDRFQSRWFGGWTSKNDVSVPAVANDKSERNLFANETSSLSESADIVPDMSSCVQRHDNDKTVSQSNIPTQHTYEKAINNRDLISDDVAVSPTPTCSPMDPLCSVVPCSFTSEAVISQNLENHVGPTVQPILDNLQVSGESSPVIRRQVASLKTYSMLYSTCDPYLDKEHTRARSSSIEHNPTAKVDTELTSQTETRKVESIVPRRKRVRFSETKISYPQVKKFKISPQTRLKDPLVASRIVKRLTRSKSKPHEVKKPRDEDNKTLFEDITFLITGFSIKKHKQIKIIIEKNGGMVFEDIPSSTFKRKRFSKIPLIILCSKKLLTTKFLYGCAVNAVILKVTWLFDSVNEGMILPHQKYKILNNHATENRNRFMFDDTAIMLHGKPDFCSKLAKVIKHGGGSVFKTFHWLTKSLDAKKASMGVIVVEDENGISRHLKQCALEQKVPMMPFNWIVKSLYAGRLLPSSQLELAGHLIHVEMSEEI